MVTVKKVRFQVEVGKGSERVSGSEREMLGRGCSVECHCFGRFGPWDRVGGKRGQNPGSVRDVEIRVL